MLQSYEDFVKKYGKRPPDIVYAFAQHNALQTVGEWLGENIAGAIMLKAGRTAKDLRQLIKALKQGKFPE